MNTSTPALRAPDGYELASLLSVLRQQRHPSLARFPDDRAALEFLLDDCCIAVFERFLVDEDGDRAAQLLMAMDGGPQVIASARLDPGGSVWQLSYTTLGDFLPYEELSPVVSKLPQRPGLSHAGPRAPDEDDLRDLLRMFRQADEPFLMQALPNDLARLAYLRDDARIAMFDAYRGGGYTGPLALMLWPAAPRVLTAAIRSAGRWRYAGGETFD